MFHNCFCLIAGKARAPEAELAAQDYQDQEAADAEADAEVGDVAGVSRDDGNSAGVRGCLLTLINAQSECLQ